MQPGDLRRFHDDAFLVEGPEGHLNGGVFIIMAVHSGSHDASLHADPGWVDILVHGGISKGWSCGGIIDLSDAVE